MIETQHFDGPLAGALHTRRAAPEFYWLGQAGFLFRSPNLTWAIDPYLSDRLAEKYRHHAFSHERLMPAPLGVAELPELDFVFCTHHHGDHLDAPTLEWIAAKQPRTRFVLPAGITAEVSRFALSSDRIVWAEAGQEITLTPGFVVKPVPAAHEEFAYDDAGRHRFLGYVFPCGPFNIYHSGDTIPYEGLTERLTALRPAAALLPVNGRRRELSERNIAGNFTLAEAIELCRGARVPVMVAHHFGMFAFNTIEESRIEEAARVAAPAVQVWKPQLGTRYRLKQ